MLPPCTHTPPLTTTDVFSVTTGLSIGESHMYGTTQHANSWDRLISLRIMLFRFTQIVLCIKSSLHFMSLDFQDIWVRFPGHAITKYHKLGGLKQHKFLLSSFWKTGVWNQGVSRAVLPLGEDPSLSPPATSESCQSLACLGLEMHHSSVCLHHHMAFSSLHMSSACLFSWGQQSPCIRAPPCGLGLTWWQLQRFCF